MGEGTKVDLTTPLSFQENQILPYVNEELANVREIQNRLALADIKKNYHQVQATLSTLVGRKLIVMDMSKFPPRYAR